jgi:hypothetical protein
MKELSLVQQVTLRLLAKRQTRTTYPGCFEDEIPKRTASALIKAGLIYQTEPRMYNGTSLYRLTDTGRAVFIRQVINEAFSMNPAAIAAKELRASEVTQDQVLHTNELLSKAGYRVVASGDFRFNSAVNAMRDLERGLDL